MNNWQEDLLTTLSQPHTFEGILHVGEQGIKALGFKNCTWITQLPIPLTRREVFAVANNNDEVTHRVRTGWYNKAPVFRICADTSRPVMWSGRAEGRLFDMNPTMWEEHFSLGRRGGWAQSVRDRIGIYSLFITSSDELLETADFEAYQRQLQWLTHAMHFAMFTSRDEHEHILSHREREILRWTGDGKTVSEIGMILSLSDGTINFHLRNAMAKLDAPNKTSAVVKAIFLKELFD